MANILLAWELGAGLGHLGRLLALGQALAGRGHRVALACGDPEGARRAAPGAGQGIEFLAAPPLALRTAIVEPANLAEVLLQFGLDDAELLAGLVAAWRRLFQEFRPAVVVLDYSPVALLALQGHPARRVLFGTGFACPPVLPSLPSLRPWQDHYPERLRFSEECLLESLNRVLAGLAQPPLERVAELYRRADLNALATLPELDHYPDRRGGDYRGVWSLPGGQAPDWPDTEGPKVFAYLKPVLAVPVLAECLADLGANSLFHVPGLDAATRQRLVRTGARVAERPLDIATVAGQADFALLHAGHNTTAAMLLAGKPVLCLPIYAEQYLLAHAVERLGAGLNVVTESADALGAALCRLHAEPGFRIAAAAFGARHAGLDAGREATRLVGEIEALAAWPATGPAV